MFTIEKLAELHCIMQRLYDLEQQGIIEDVTFTLKLAHNAYHVSCHVLKPDIFKDIVQSKTNTKH